MRILTVFLLVGVLLASAAAAEDAKALPQGAPAGVAAATPVVVAVLPCEAGDPDLLDLAKALPELVSTSLTRDKRITLVERERLNQIITEQSLGVSGLVDPDNAARIGKLLGARLLVLLRTYAVGDQIFVSAKVVTVESGRLLATTKSTNRRGMSPVMVAGLIGEDVQRLVAQAALVPTAPSDDDRYKQVIADLSKLLGDRKRPSITVVVPEEQLRLVVPDPAVKTELCYLLRKLKFRVIENDSPLLDQWVHDYFAGKVGKFPAEVGDVDLVIYGGAFASTVGTHGNLVSSRARLELSAIKVKTSEIYAVGRATASAADVSESVAGKSALVNATLAAAKDFLTDLITALDDPSK